MPMECLTIKVEIMLGAAGHLQARQRNLIPLTVPSKVILLRPKQTKSLVMREKEDLLEKLAALL